MLERDSKLDELTEALGVLRAELAEFEGKEEELVNTNASSMGIIVGKENELRQAAARLERERRLREAEKVAYNRRIAMLENLRQSLVPGIDSEVDSAYWNFCVSLRGIASHERAFNANLCDRGGVRLLVILCAKSQSPEVILAAASAMAELAVDGKSRRRILSLGGIKPLCVLLNDACAAAGKGTATLAEQQMIGLVAFAVSRLAIDPLIRAELARAGALGPLAALCRHSRNRITLHAACMAMANLSFENAANKVRIVSGGAVEAVVRIIGEETEDAVVFEAAKCLANITCDNRPGQQEVSKAGGVQAMVFLLGRKALPITTKQAILGALGNVALNQSMGKPTVVASAGLMPMIRFMAKRKTPQAVVAQAAKALGNTAFGAQAVKARIMAEKAGPPLVARLIESAKMTAAARLQMSHNGGQMTDLEIEMTTQICKTITSLALNRDNARLFANFGALEPACELCDASHELAVLVGAGPEREGADGGDEGGAVGDGGGDSDADSDTSNNAANGEEGEAPFRSTTPRADPNRSRVAAVDSRAALLAAITINDEVRDIAVERLDAAKSMVRAACAYLCAHRHDRSNPTRPYPLRPPFPVSADQLPKPEVLANYPGLPPWLKLGLMRLAPRASVDPDELYYTAEQVRLNGEFWPDFECYSEYFTSAEVTLISGSDVLQATR